MTKCLYCGQKKIKNPAKARKNAGDCVVSGLHSQIEKDVFDIAIRYPYYMYAFYYLI